MVPLAFEIEHGINNVLECLGAGETAVLGDVADEKRREVLAFGREQQLRGRFANLTDAARGRLELQRIDGLDRIDDHECGFDARDFLENTLETGFGEQKAQIFMALLGKQYGVTPKGWRAAAGEFGQPGTCMSVADIVDARSLGQVRSYKKKMKAAAKGKAAT